MPRKKAAAQNPVSSETSPGPVSLETGPPARPKRPVRTPDKLLDLLVQDEPVNIQDTLSHIVQALGGMAMFAQAVALEFKSAPANSQVKQKWALLLTRMFEHVAKSGTDKKADLEGLATEDLQKVAAQLMSKARL